MLNTKRRQLKLTQNFLLLRIIKAALFVLFILLTSTTSADSFTANSNSNANTNSGRHSTYMHTSKTTAAQLFANFRRKNKATATRSLFLLRRSRLSSSTSNSHNHNPLLTSRTAGKESISSSSNGSQARRLFQYPTSNLFSSTASGTDDNNKTSTSDDDENNNNKTTTTSNFTPPDPERLSSLMPEYDANGRPYTLYEKCVRRLYLTNLFHPVRLGLLNMEQLHSALNYPMDDPNITVVHVAGTNGKGSVSLKIARTLEAAGHTVGLFVSPHVASFRERMQVNGDLISEKEVEEYLPMIYDICERDHIPATFFEVTTALAFHFFASRNVDVVVLETGLGGRLDATNVVTNPDLCVITSIGLEHTRILGDTVELIAMEKAGIIKKDAPVLVGPNCPHDVIRQCALEKEAAGYYMCNDVLQPVTVEIEGTNTNAAYVDYDIENSRTARAAIKLLETSSRNKLKLPMEDSVMEKALAQRPPCRFQEMTVETDKGNNIKVLLDVAHNPDAMEHLIHKLAVSYPSNPMRIVVGFSADKDLQDCGSTLLSHVKDPHRIHLVEAAHPRAAKLEDMLEAEPRLREANFDEANRSITAQVKLAIDLVEQSRDNADLKTSREEEIVVVCGSVFLMAEAREAIGIDEPRDSKYIAEVAGANLRHGQEFFADTGIDADMADKK
uniref:Mur ligase C-terminal domain-containing protein n=1 Tax=Chaetoceros debilis TaxID=122233 RepID=A0A7S3V740_9STRA